VKSERRTDNKISYQCGTLIRISIISVAHTDNRFYAACRGPTKRHRQRRRG